MAPQGPPGAAKEGRGKEEGGEKRGKKEKKKIENFHGGFHFTDPALTPRSHSNRPGTYARVGAYTPPRALERCRRGLFLETPRTPQAPLRPPPYRGRNSRWGESRRLPLVKSGR